jgi:hypothetical protein
MVPEGSLPHSQKPPTRHYHDIEQFSPCLSIPLLQDPFYYFPPIYAKIVPVVSFPQISPLKPYTHLPSPPDMLHAPPIPFFLIWSPQ